MRRRLKGGGLISGEDDGMADARFYEGTIVSAQQLG